VVVGAVVHRCVQVRPARLQRREMAVQVVIARALRKETVQEAQKNVSDIR
jgi:hypothetical protein